MKTYLSIFRFTIILMMTLYCFPSAFAQIGLEAIIVEEYYTATAADAVPVFGVPGPEEGAVTYRIYVDMAPGWQIQQVAGFAQSPININTTTGFYNATGAGVQFADAFSPFAFGIGAVPLDSYFTFGIGGPGMAGIPKDDDTNGSIFNGVDRLQGNINPINVSDGLVPTDGEQLATQLLGSGNLDIVNVNGASEYFVSNTIFFNLNGSRGIAPGNKVLIAQLTTTGELSFNINVQIFNNDVPPSITEVYTHTPLTGQPDDIMIYQFPGLTYPVPDIEGCTNAGACNYNPAATTDDDSCILPVPNCEICNEDNTGLVLVDTDGDGICDSLDPCPLLADLTNGNECITTEGESGFVADCVCVLQVIDGCTIQTACNFNPDANQNDGSCLIPIENCFICNEDNTDLEILDDDGDGICNAQEIPGCTSETACNYNPAATDSVDNCIEPVENCQICNATNTGLILVDSDGDGICDADEIPGCSAAEACNYMPEATDDDGSCLIPVENCSACNDDNTDLVIIDDDGDGICNANEIFGCTDPLAENYNPDATEDDGSCIITNTANTAISNPIIKLHPNPTRDIITVEIDESYFKAGRLSLTISDILGNELISRRLDGSVFGKTFTLDLRSLQNGVYLLSVISIDDRSSIRVVKTN